MSTNDNSINARFCWQLSATPTDCLKKKYARQFVSAEKNFFRDFRFSFRRESSFPRRIPGSAEGTPCLYHACAKRRWRLGGRKCRKMPESNICVCRKAKVVESHIVHVEIELKKKKKNFDFESLVLRKFRKITAISHPWEFDHHTQRTKHVHIILLKNLQMNKSYVKTPKQITSNLRFA